MSKSSIKKTVHACPRNCPSACSIISYTENSRLIHLIGDSNDPYTKGKLCAKGFSFIEENNHPNRLKFPYYQEVKGSGRLRQITWEKAFELILQKITSTYERYNNFQPIAFYKGTGNVGIHHFVTEQFFNSLKSPTRIVSPSESMAALAAIKYDMGALKTSDLTTIKDAKLIIIWGANPAATNIHLIPFIIEARVKGAKVVVIDPLYTQTAELADLFIQLHPSTDAILANFLLKNLVKQNAIDHIFIEQHTIGVKKFVDALKEVDEAACIKKCDVPKEAIRLLFNWIKNAPVVSHIIGSGLTKHTNGGQSVRAIQALAAIRGDIGKLGGGIFFRHKEEHIFNNQRFKENNRVVHLNELTRWDNSIQLQPPIEMLWITCANPLVRSPNALALKQSIEKIPFVVTVDHFLTPSAKTANLILPTTTHFEELDIIISSLHRKISINEQAVSPFYQSKSEWRIMNNLAKRLNDYSKNICSFPIYSSEEEYLNAQFNDNVYNRYFVKNVEDLRKKTTILKTAPAYTPAWKERKFATKTGKYQFFSKEAKADGQPAMPIWVDGKLPTVKHPFWLITPHHPYALNSQFHFLHISDEREKYVEINPKMANKLGVFEGEVVKVYNDIGSIEIKTLFNSHIPNDIAMIYNSWHENSGVNVNELVSLLKTDMVVKSKSNRYAFFDTFVNISKL